MKNIRFLIIILLFAYPFFLFSSDRSDATDLMNKSDSDAKELEIAVRNFGDAAENVKYDEGIKIIKLGKVKLAQSKFLDAKAQFEKFLKIENELYQSMAPKYMERAQILIDKTSEDLVDFVSNPAVMKNFSEASRILDTAKTHFSQNKFQYSLQSSRISKTYVLNNYTLAKKPVPKEYIKDMADANKKLYVE
jgi:hypothetical protein